METQRQLAGGQRLIQEAACGSSAVLEHGPLQLEVGLGRLQKLLSFGEFVSCHAPRRRTQAASIGQPMHCASAA